jgi:hypothetical protein
MILESNENRKARRGVEDGTIHSCAHLPQELVNLDDLDPAEQILNAGPRIILDHS